VKTAGIMPPDDVIALWLYGDWRVPLPPLGAAAHGPFLFDGYVKAGLGPSSEGTPAREIRAWMLKAAEDALDALIAAGWVLTRYPAMEFSGSIDMACHGNFAVQVLGGELVTLSQQHSFALRVRFEVDRPR
jgi:hypothetical protein